MSHAVKGESFPVYVNKTEAMTILQHFRDHPVKHPSGDGRMSVNAVYSSNDNVIRIHFGGPEPSLDDLIAEWLGSNDPEIQEKLFDRLVKAGCHNGCDGTLYAFAQNERIVFLRAVWKSMISDILSTKRFPIEISH